MAQILDKANRRGMILFAHGARDARWAEPFLRLQQQVQNQLQTQLQDQAQEVIVCLAFLEFMQPTLVQAVQQLLAQDCHEISVIPVFLAQGGHVLRDLPALIQNLQQEYPHLQISLAKAIGEDPAVIQAIANYCVQAGLPTQAAS